MDKLFIDILRSRSPYYPEHYTYHTIEAGRDTYYFSSIVRIERNGKWYGIHVAEGISLNDEVGIMDLYRKFTHYVYKVQHLWNITDEEPHEWQISERERLSNDHLLR